MKKITLETTKVDGKIYYELLVDGKGVSGTYVFEIILKNWMDLKQKFVLLGEGVK